jgi:anti-sigma regulatory factor (Ser/Thr protein kinase)
VTVVVPFPSDDIASSAVPARWARHSYLELGALVTAVPCARKHAHLVVREWGLPELADTVELVISELVTNAVRASAGLTGSRYQGQWIPGVPPIRMWLCSDGEQVLIKVWDSNDQHPVNQQPDPEAESGRGLWLVDMLTEEQGTCAIEGATGKIVWALVAR